jgi:DNA-binding response OmpR family regulator
MRSCANTPGASAPAMRVKRAIWPVSPPSDSALQKIIERIRDKIEPDPKHPRKLIAVRGQGYMLRRNGA